MIVFLTHPTAYDFLDKKIEEVIIVAEVKIAFEFVL